MITSEKKLPKELEKYQIRLPPEKLHDLLAFATLYIGESATLASEAAILGVPAIYVCNSKRGYTNEQEKRFGLVYNFTNENTALKKAIELLKKKNIKREWVEKKSLLLKEQVDLTSWMVDFIEGLR
jgi:predicted glycosyltransferase